MGNFDILTVNKINTTGVIDVGNSTDTATSIFDRDIDTEFQIAQESWTTRSAAGGYTNNFGAVAYGDNLYVVVGAGGEIQTSVTGTAWTQQSAAGGYTGGFLGLTYGDSLYVAVGGAGEIQTSVTGTAWIQQSAAGGFSGAFAAVEYESSLYVAVGSAGEIQTSVTGTAWTQQSAAGGYNGDLYDVTYGNNMWVIVGTAGAIQTSVTGTAWTQQSAAGGYTGRFTGIGYGNNTFVAVGTSGEIQTSVTGTAWTQQSADAGYSGGFRDLVFANNRFVAVGGSAEIQISYDGISWQNQSAASTFTNTFFGVNYGSELFLAVGDDGEIETWFGDGIEITFPVPKILSHIVMQNIALQEFYLEWSTLTTWSPFTISNADTTISYWFNNSDTSKYLYFSSISVNKIKLYTFDASATIKQLWALEKKFTFENNPTAKDYKAKLKRKKISHAMSDGGNVVYVFGDSYQSDIKLKYQSETMRDNLKTLYDDQKTFTIVSYPTGTAWEGIEIYEVNWDGDFDFKQPAGNNYSDLGWTGSIKLKETPK
jgi:hypothetical protein